MHKKDDDKPQVIMAQAIRALTEHWATRVEFEKAMAKMARLKFLALVAEGFTEEQALQLVRW